MRKTKALIGLALAAFLVTGGTAFAASHIFSGSYSQNVHVNSAISIYAVQDTLGQSCTNTQTTATCPDASIYTGGSYTVEVTIANSANQGISVTLTPASTNSTVLSISAPSTATVPANGQYTFSFTVTAGSPGSATVSASIDA